AATEDGAEPVDDRPNRGPIPQRIGIEFDAFGVDETGVRTDADAEHPDVAGPSQTGHRGLEVTSEVILTIGERGSRVGRQTITDDDDGRFRRLLAAQPANRPSQGLRIDALPIQRGLAQTAEAG